MNDFSSLAQYYDRFVGADYSNICRYIDQKIRQHIPNASLVCDIGCGSGSLTFSLLEKGYDMIGIDGSIDMLAEAMEKKCEFENGEKALFLCQQLPEFELYGTVDAIVSTLDTINYITEPKDLDRLFYWFRNYLNPGGLLIFDVNSLYKYQSILNQNNEIYEEDDVFITWRSTFENDLCEHHLTFFSLEEDDLYRREDEEQIQRYYSLDYIKELLEKYQFTLLNENDDYSDLLPSKETQRITIVARKESN